MPVIWYPYSRYSSNPQEHGHSEERQGEGFERTCRAHHGVPDYSLELYDRGMSARKGKNRLVGALKRFLDAIQSGRVTAGQVLYTENLDRLSREQLRKAWRLWEEILEAGVGIYVAEPFAKLYTAASLDNFTDWIMPLMEMHRAWMESERKSDMVGKAWRKKRKLVADWLEARAKARADGKPLPQQPRLTGRCPAWLWPAGAERLGPQDRPDDLERGNEAWEVRGGRKESLRRAAQLVRDGHSFKDACRKLAGEYPAFGRTVWRRAPRKVCWEPATLHYWLTSRELCGEFCPKGREPIPDYFPAILTEGEWADLQASIGSRRSKRGRPTCHAENLLSGILYNATNGKKVWLGTARRPPESGLKTHAYLFDPDNRSLCVYEECEAALLRTLSELRPEEFRGGEAADELTQRIQSLGNRVANLDISLQALKKRVAAAADRPELLEVLLGSVDEVAAQKAAAAKELAALNLEAKTVTDQSLVGVQSILDAYRGATEEEKPDLARRLKTEIGLLVREVWLLVQPVCRGRKLVHYRIYFRSGLEKPGRFVGGQWGRHQTAEPWDMDGADLRSWRETRGGK